MAHVLKADLAKGQLLEMDDDLPELLSAAETAAGSLRELIGDLRRSNIGRGGLQLALDRLVKSMGAHTTAKLHIRSEAVHLPASGELVMYQIGKEALANAIAHSEATNIWLALFEDLGDVHLSIRDDGIGFDPALGKESHYGIHIMHERAASIGGQLFVDSAPGRGTTVALHMTV